MIDVLVALFVAGALNLVILDQIRRRMPEEDGSFLRKVYRWTLFLRTLLALFLYINLDASGLAGLSTFAVTFWGDSSTYDFRGHLLARYWAGDTLIDPVGSTMSGWGFYYFVGFVYSVFGRNQILVQLLNATLGSLTVLVVYGISARLFDRQVARWAALFMALFPQMVFWSGGMYKDTAVLLCIALCMYAVIRLSDQLNLRMTLVFVAAALALMTLRFYVFYIVIFATLGTFLLFHRGGVIRGLFAQLALVAVFLGAFSFAAGRETVERQAGFFDLNRVQVTRSDQARWGRSAFAAEADVSTTSGALAALPTGLTYLLFAPFPWSVGSIRQALTVPETLVWYALMPAFVRGLRYTVRHRLRPCLPILIFAGTLTVAYAIFQGNVGTAYRQRTQVTMFFFILMGVGIELKRKAKEASRPGGRVTLDDVPRPAWQR